MDLSTLTPAESDALWWRIIRATAATADEIDSLTLAPASIRDGLYGAGCLESYAAMCGELADLAAELADTPLSRIMALRDDTPEEGTREWLSETAKTHPPAMTWARLAARVTLRRALRRLTRPR